MSATSSSLPATKVVGTISHPEDWNAIHLRDLSDSCHWIELRLDAMPLDQGLDQLLQHRPSMPLLFTARAREEGGIQVLDDADRFDLLRQALPFATAIDIEIAHLAEAQDLVQAAHQASVQVIASAHDFQKTPDLGELIEWESRARELGADTAKFAFRLHSPEDIMTGCRLLDQRKGDMAVMGMGPLGPTSRLLYSQCGSSLIYGYLGSSAAAPGQWPAKAFLEAVRSLDKYSSSKA